MRSHLEAFPETSRLPGSGSKVRLEPPRARLILWYFPTMIAVGVPRWFAALGLLLGIAYALLMGPLGVPDETGHMYRSYLVSEGICKGVPAIGAPIDYRRDLGRLYPWIQLPANSTGQDLVKLIDPAHGRSRDLISTFYITNIYSCAPYLPQGIGFRVGRFFTASPLTLMYIGRLANLLCYLLLVLLAMYLLPQFQLPIAMLALMPMSLHQAASLSGDSFAIGFSFTLAAWLLSLAFADPPTRHCSPGFSLRRR